MVVQWLPLSMFDLQSHFTISFQSLVLDLSIAQDTLNISRFGEFEEHRKVKFHTDTEFEMFLKMELKRRLQAQT